MHSALKITKYLRINQRKYRTRNKEIEGDMGEQKDISMLMYQICTLFKWPFYAIPVNIPRVTITEPDRNSPGLHVRVSAALMC